MPQLDLVSFPSQVFWLVIFFVIFYSFVSGHFVPLLHKIVQTRSKKIAMSQDLASGQLDAQTSARSASEGLLVVTLDKSAAGLMACSEEAASGQVVELASGDKSQVASLATTVASIQGRYLVSRGALFFRVFSVVFNLNFFYFLWSLITNILLIGKLVF
jgi:F-type H+-transporting ATPase subunit b